MAEVEARGIRFHVQHFGSGPRTAVFLHGLVMDNLSSWFFTVANAAARVAEVVLYDLRGHGRSERPVSGYTIEDMVADLAGLLDALGLGDREVELVGNSFGGLLALAFAVAHPERVSGMVLVDANMSDEKWRTIEIPKFRARGEARAELARRYTYPWAGRYGERKQNQLRENADELVYRTSLIDDLEQAPSPEDEELARIACPVLALYGADSELLDRAERLARVIPGCEVRYVEGGTHLLLVEATDRVRDEVVAWLQRD